jgi:ribosomal protein S1
MSFVQFFQQSNTSCNHLQGNVVQCSVEHTRGDKVFLRTGLKSSTVCLNTELNTESGKNLMVGIEKVELLEEPRIVLPKSLQQICRRKLVWTALTKVWRGSPNRIGGFVLNSVNGGYAVAIAGHIAFLPKSLRIESKVFPSQWRLFSILNMNAKIRNIVVKELATQTNKTRSSSEIRLNRLRRGKHNAVIMSNEKENRLKRHL